MAILEIDNIKKIYKNGKVALNGVSFKINQGEFVALLGVNGAGKSTLINILGDVVIKTSGKAKCCGYDFDTQKIEFKRNIGIVPQDINIDPFFTPYEVLKLQQGFHGLPFNKAKIEETLNNMGLESQAHLNARSLSGGMKRRLMIAKALVNDPKIVVLDEPTAGVDVELRQHLWKFFKAQNNKGVTIILTTHYLEEAQHLCDKVAIINKGELISFENKDKLLSKVGSKSLTIALNKEVEDNSSISFSYTKLENNTISVNYKEDSDVGVILESLIGKGYHVDSIRLTESSLEDVFIKLTS